MILTEDIYNEIVFKFENHSGSYRDLKNALMLEYDIPNPVISSILSNEFRRRVKKNFNRMANLGNKLFQRYLNSRSSEKNLGVIMQLAEEIKMSYSLVGRTIAEKFCEHDDLELVANRVPKLKYWMKDTTLVDDEDLACELFLCILYDEQYGYLTETINQSLGREYECYLRNILLQRKLAFQCEDDLRLRGYDKTPDIKLNVPFAVEGFVVNWIESKALFASPKIHKEYIDEQYSSYWNRFGTGLVIYWKGMVDSIIDPKEKRFIVRCRFPDNITLLNPFCSSSIPNELQYDGNMSLR